MKPPVMVVVALSPLVEVSMRTIGSAVVEVAMVHAHVLLLMIVEVAVVL